MNYITAKNNDLKQVFYLLPDSLKNKLYLQDTLTYIAKNDTGEIAGFIVAQSGRNECQILWLQVDKEYQRSGIATLLWRMLLLQIGNDIHIGRVIAVMPEDLSPIEPFVIFLLRMGFVWDNGQAICSAFATDFSNSEIMRKKLRYSHVYSLKELLSQPHLRSCWRRMENNSFAISDYALKYEYDHDCSFIAIKDGSVMGYIFIQALDENRLNIAYLAQSRTGDLTSIYLMDAAGRAVLQKYAEDTKVVMNAMNDQIVKLIRKIFPNGNWSQEKLLVYDINPY